MASNLDPPAPPRASSPPSPASLCSRSRSPSGSWRRRCSCSRCRGGARRRELGARDLQPLARHARRGPRRRGRLPRRPRAARGAALHRPRRSAREPRHAAGRISRARGDRVRPPIAPRNDRGIDDRPDPLAGVAELRATEPTAIHWNAAAGWTRSSCAVAPWNGGCRRASRLAVVGSRGRAGGRDRCASPVGA